jgi:hypothetical protein
LATKPKNYHCMNNSCGYYLNSLKKGKKGVHQRWKVLTAHLEPGSFVEKTYCPHCKWELKLGLFEANKVDEKLPSALELLQRIPIGSLQDAK